MSSIAIVSTGDDEKDRDELARAQTFSDRIDEGICPNGCAELEWSTPNKGECPVCHFLLSTGVPYGKREIEQVM